MKLVEPPGSDLDPDPSPSSLAEMLEAVPLHVQIDSGVDMDAAHSGTDPCLTDSGKRVCIAVRRAGGRCSAVAPAHSLLCNAHSGVLDASAGGRARAKQQQEQQLGAAEVARLARLGARGVIAVTAHEHPLLVRKAFLTLLEDAAEGNHSAARLVGPWLNQGLGMPVETVVPAAPESASDLGHMTTEQLREYVASKRAARLAEAS